MKKLVWLAALTIFQMLAGGAHARAPIPIEDLFRAPVLQRVAISPDGQHIAAIQSVDGQPSIVLLSPDGKTLNVVLKGDGRSFDALQWSSDSRWLLYLQDSFGDEGYHLYRVAPEANAPKPLDLTPIKGIAAELVPGNSAPGTVLVAINARTPDYSDVWSVNLNTGARTEILRNKDGYTEFFSDRLGRLAAATAIKADGRIQVVSLAAGGSAATVYTARADERFKVLAIAQDGGTILARSNRDDAVERLISISRGTGNAEPLGDHMCGRFDLDAVHQLPGRGALLFACVTDKAELRANSPEAQQAIADLHRLLGPRASLSIESASSDFRTFAVYSDESDVPGRFAIYRKGHGASLLGHLRPWLTMPLAKTEAHWIKMRDGLEILAYVTRSPHSQGAQPVVVSLHGGPWSRDSGGFEPETQLLADRGYTVIQPNFRGSTGFGKAVFDAGVGQFGAAMSDDVDDVAIWAIAKRLALPDKICLLGGSYGGYATLMGLARGTVPYQCGASFAGPFDLETLIRSFPPSWRPFLPRSWHRFVGDPDIAAQSERMAQRSPVTFVDRIRVPVLVFQGANDPRVRKDHSDALICALRARKVSSEYMLALDAGHSFGQPETTQAVMRTTELFLSKILGGRVQSNFDAALEARRMLLIAAGAKVPCP
jgi:dipeptidyl aminopeptidase/acylaminoacyl peptidase